MQPIETPMTVSPLAPAATMIDVKIHYAGDCRRFTIPSSATLSELKTQIAALCALTQAPELAWEDEDEDKIVIRTEDDWHCCLAHADDGVVRLHVHRPFVPASSYLTAATTALHSLHAVHARVHAACHEKLARKMEFKTKAHGVVRRTVGSLAAVALLPCAATCAFRAVGHLLGAAIPLAIACAIGKFSYRQLCSTAGSPAAAAPAAAAAAPAAASSSMAAGPTAPPPPAPAEAPSAPEAPQQAAGGLYPAVPAAPSVSAMFPAQGAAAARGPFPPVPFENLPQFLAAVMGQRWW